MRVVHMYAVRVAHLRSQDTTYPLGNSSKDKEDILGRRCQRLWACMVHLPQDEHAMLGGKSAHTYLVHRHANISLPLVLQGNDLLFTVSF
jgi:hypothetical protein